MFAGENSPCNGLSRTSPDVYLTVFRDDFQLKLFVLRKSEMLQFSGLYRMLLRTYSNARNLSSQLGPDLWSNDGSETNETIIVEDLFRCPPGGRLIALPDEAS